MKPLLLLICVLGLVAPARSSVLYAFTLEESPNAVFTFDFLEPTFLTGPAYVTAPSNSVSCSYDGTSESCLNVWGFPSEGAIAVDLSLSSAGVTMNDLYTCPNCEFDSFSNVQQSFSDLNLSAPGTYINSTGGELQISSSPLATLAPEPASWALCALAIAAAVLITARVRARRN